MQRAVGVLPLLFSPHVSHHRGIDADIHVIEAGTFGEAGYKKEVALLANPFD